jgi:nitrate/nitrite-specific signal transduction histidine kinase
LAQQLINASKINTQNATDHITSAKKALLFLLLFFILAVLIIGILTTRSLSIPINFINKELRQMGLGVLPEHKLPERSDELGEMAANLNSLVEGLKDLSTFSIEIGKGNFNSEFKPLSVNDRLGNALIKMREELKEAGKEEQKRKQEDEHRNWSSQGIARFSELLRENNNNLAELSFNIISNLVKYCNLNQGGLFIVEQNHNHKSINMAACYAYDRRKYEKVHFEWGEGLIGRCVLEQQSIFLTEIPKDYIHITSGMGEDNPTCLLIVPLKANQVVHGVMELASFQLIEQYQIDFIERIAESIASTISNVKINIQTSQLLEQSRKQAEEMVTQEEEMRQGMEELRATQEQSALREAELKKEIEDLKRSSK